MQNKREMMDRSIGRPRAERRINHTAHWKSSAVFWGLATFGWEGGWKEKIWGFQNFSRTKLVSVVGIDSSMKIPSTKIVFLFTVKKKKCSYPPPNTECRQPHPLFKYLCYYTILAEKIKWKKIYPTMLCTILWKMFSEMGVEASNGIKGTFWQILRRNDGEGGFLSSSLRKTLMCVPLLCYLIDTHTQKSYHLNSVKSMWTSRELGGFSLFISQPPLLWRTVRNSIEHKRRTRKKKRQWEAFHLDRKQKNSFFSIFKRLLIDVFASARAPFSSFFLHS